MNRVIPLILRRMRWPLILIIVTYAIAILGMVLIPGVDDKGRPWHMDFFHAFYFVSYTATTIGFGELPYLFSDAQRMWTIFSVYLTVIAWVYAIGNIIALLQDPAFEQVVTERHFGRTVRRLVEPFYIVCGYGDTGAMLVRALTDRGFGAVVLDIDRDRVAELHLEEFPIYVPSMRADASLSGPLIQAGLLNPHCAGLVAITGSDEVNLRIAITSKLLNPKLKVCCRAEREETVASIGSFGTDQIINPFDVFSKHLALALHSPATHAIHEWLTGVTGTPLPEPIAPPHGMWILCGYGRFGRAVAEELHREGVETVIVEPRADLVECVGDFCVPGHGTDAETLRKAGIDRAAGIVAGSDNDAKNLSIIMIARSLHPGLFLVARQNLSDNTPIFEAAGLSLVMQRSETIARRIITLLATPLLSEFLALVDRQEDHWVEALGAELRAVSARVPMVWDCVIDEESAPAVARAIDQNFDVRIRTVAHDPKDRETPLPLLVLMLVRGDEKILLPDQGMPLLAGDRLLFCGCPAAFRAMRWNLLNTSVIHYMLTGRELAGGAVWRWLSERRRRRQQAVV